MQLFCLIINLSLGLLIKMTHKYWKAINVINVVIIKMLQRKFSDSNGWKYAVSTMLGFKNMYFNLSIQQKRPPERTFEAVWFFVRREIKNVFLRFLLQLFSTKRFIYLTLNLNLNKLLLNSGIFIIFFFYKILFECINFPICLKF